MNRIAVLAGALCLASFASSQVTTFDFEGVSTGDRTSLSMTNGGVTVTITRSTLTTFLVEDLTGYAPAAWGVRSLSPFSGTSNGGDYFVATFSSAVHGVTIRFSDLFGDDDNPFMNAFSGANGTGALLDTSTVLWPDSSGFPGDSFLTVSSLSGIRSITFGNSLTDEYNTSLYWDNLVLRGSSAVPGPAAALPFALGLLARRRRKL